MEEHWTATWFETAGCPQPVLESTPELDITMVRNVSSGVYKRLLTGTHLSFLCPQARMYAT
jgi:hypothetical protein